MIWKQLRPFTRGMIGWCAVWIALGLYTGFPGLVAAQGVDLPSPTLSANDLWLLVYAVLVAFAVNAIKALPPHFTPWQKRGIAAACALGFTVVTLYYGGRLDLGNMGLTWMVIFLGASGIYVTVLKPAADWVAGRPQT